MKDSAREPSGEPQSFFKKLQSALAAGKDFSLEGLNLAHAAGRELQSPLNAIFGDFLDRNQNPLAISMGLLIQGTDDRFVPLELDKKALQNSLPPLVARRRARNKGDATTGDLASLPQRVCIFIHGLGSSERTWHVRRNHEKPKAAERAEKATSPAGESSAVRAAPSPGREKPGSYTRLLQRDTDLLCLFLRYNTGRHISTNGRELAGMLERFRKAYPGKLREINLIGHSMGGLVSRSAAFYGQEAGHKWPGLLARNFLLGSPLLGAHQEQIGKLTTDVLNAIPLPGTRVTARLLDFRSDGIQDLGYGYLRDEDWDEKPGGALKNRRNPVPLVQKARYFLIIGSLSKDPEGIVGGFLGDGIVNRWSARGASGNNRENYEAYADDAKSGKSAAESRIISREIIGLSHTAIPGDPRVFRQMRNWLRA